MRIAMETSGISSLAIPLTAIALLAGCHSSESHGDWDVEDDVGEPEEIDAAGQPTVDPALCTDVSQREDDGEFERDADDRWVRDFGGFAQGCGVYAAQMTLDLSADERDEWEYALDYEYCNRCDVEREIRWSHETGSNGEQHDDRVEDELDEFPEHRVPVIVEHDDEHRFPSPCLMSGDQNNVQTTTWTYRVPLSPGETTETTFDEKIRSFTPIDAQTTRQQEYWERPVDFSEPLDGSLWWSELYAPSESLTKTYPDNKDHCIRFDVVAGLGGPAPDIEEMYAEQPVGALDFPEPVADYLADLDEQMREDFDWVE